MDTPSFQVGDLVMIADDFVRPDYRGVVYRVTRKLKAGDAEPAQPGNPPQATNPTPDEEIR